MNKIEQPGAKIECVVADLPYSLYWEHVRADETLVLYRMTEAGKKREYGRVNLLANPSTYHVDKTDASLANMFRGGSHFATLFEAMQCLEQAALDAYANAVERKRREEALLAERMPEVEKELRLRQEANTKREMARANILRMENNELLNPLQAPDRNPAARATEESSVEDEEYAQRAADRKNLKETGDESHA